MTAAPCLPQGGIGRATQGNAPQPARGPDVALPPRLGWLKPWLAKTRSHLVPSWCLSHQLGCLCASVGASQARTPLGLAVLASTGRSGSAGHGSAQRGTATRPIQDCTSAWEQSVSIFHLYCNINKDRRRKNKPSVWHQKPDLLTKGIASTSPSIPHLLRIGNYCSCNSI